MSNKMEITAAFAGKVSTHGSVPDVSVITEGEAKGHNWHVGPETLADVLRLGQGSPNGIRVNVDHGSGFAGIIGWLKNFRLRGSQVIADMKLLPNHEAFRKVTDIINSIPHAIGLSVSFAGKIEERAGKRWARMTELYSVDLVDVPAANPNGLFSAVLSEVTKNTRQGFTLRQARRLASELFGGGHLVQETNNDLEWSALAQEFLKNGIEVPWTGEKPSAETDRILSFGVNRAVRAFRRDALKAFLAANK